MFICRRGQELTPRNRKNRRYFRKLKRKDDAKSWNAIEKCRVRNKKAENHHTNHFYKKRLAKLKRGDLIVVPGYYLGPSMVAEFLFQAGKKSMVVKYHGFYGTACGSGIPLYFYELERSKSLIGTTRRIAAKYPFNINDHHKSFPTYRELVESKIKHPTEELENQEKDYLCSIHQDSVNRWKQALTTLKLLLD